MSILQFLPMAQFRSTTVPNSVIPEFRESGFPNSAVLDSVNYTRHILLNFACKITSNLGPKHTTSLGKQMCNLISI